VKMQGLKEEDRSDQMPNVLAEVKKKQIRGGRNKPTK